MLGNERSSVPRDLMQVVPMTDRNVGVWDDQLTLGLLKTSFCRG